MPALGVERTDFVNVATQDLERAKRFYGEVLGLSAQRAFERPVPNVDEAKTKLEQAGVEFDFETVYDNGRCHMAFFEDPDGNALILHRRYATYSDGSRR